MSQGVFWLRQGERSDDTSISLLKDFGSYRAVSNVYILFAFPEQTPSPNLPYFECSTYILHLYILAQIHICLGRQAGITHLD